MRRLSTILGFRENRLLILAGTAVVVLVTTLLASNYYGYQELKRSTFDELEMSVARRAEGLGYFFSERRNDLEDLLYSRTVLNYIEKVDRKAAADDIASINEKLSELRHRKRIGSTPIYQRLTLLDPGGSILADTDPAGSTAPAYPTLTEKSGPISLSAVPQGENCNLLLTHELRFKGETAGLLVATISHAPLFSRFLNSGSAETSQYSYIDYGGFDLYSSHGRAKSLAQKIQKGWQSSMGSPLFPVSLPEKTSGEQLYGVRLPIPGTEFSIVSTLPASMLPSGETTWRLLAIMALLSSSILGGAIWLSFSRTENIMLQAQMDKEQSVREVLEEAKRDLEMCVQHRTRDLQDALEKIRSISNTDELTALPNRRAIFDELGSHIRHVRRHREPFSVILVDIDFFKKINDGYGHQAGDAVLKGCADLFAGTLRGGDRMGRYGGEEFLGLLPCTPLAGAMLVAERLRAMVENARFPVEGAPPVGLTCSFGVAEFNAESEDREGLIHRVDEALYQAKREGRNRVCASALGRPAQDGPGKTQPGPME